MHTVTSVLIHPANILSTNLPCVPSHLKLIRCLFRPISAEPILESSLETLDAGAGSLVGDNHHHNHQLHEDIVALALNEAAAACIEEKMSKPTTEGESRPSFMVGDQDDQDSSTASPTTLNNGVPDASGEDRDYFNQNYSQKPSGFDLAEKRKRLR